MEEPPTPQPWAEMSKKRRALEGGGGGGEPQLPEEEPPAWSGGRGGEEQGRGRGRAGEGRQAAFRSWDPLQECRPLCQGNLGRLFPTNGFHMCLQETGGRVGRS